MSMTPDFANFDRNRPEKRDNPVLIEFFKDFFSYISWRSRQLLFFFLALLKLLVDGLGNFKSFLVRRMFWGRGSFYRTAFHLFVFTTTVIVALSGISSRLNIIAESANGTLALNDNIIGSQDIIYQSGTAEVLSSINESEADFEVYKYVVQSGDTLSSIAKLYNKNINTLVWANSLSGSSAVLKVGQVLRIPAIDGAYYTVKKGDSLDSIAKYTNSNSVDIWDLNSKVINYDNPVLAAGMELFIPNGVIPTTTAPAKKVTVGGATKSGLNVPSGTFVHPLLHCPGWSWSRGFSSTHGGADMAKAGGCWINAIGNGYVKKAGWGGWGFTVIIDHGNGLVSIYGHGTGTFAVKQGDYVQAGQDIMYMGNSGYSFGTHLHLEIQLNGVKINPESIVKLR